MYMWRNIYKLLTQPLKWSSRPIGLQRTDGVKAILNVMADETDTTTYAHSEHKGSDVLMSFLTPASVQFFLDSSPAVGLEYT